MKILEETYLFHELNIEVCLSKIQIPKIDRYEDHLFVILHFPSIDKIESISRTTHLAIFAGFDYLVTVQQGELKPLTEMFELCKISEKQRDLFMGTTSGYLLHCSGISKDKVGLDNRVLVSDNVHYAINAAYI
jgi:magnesium transporter